jgi:threonine dehydrogenase-like Zn-dependent dehydrogenase
MQAIVLRQFGDMVVEERPDPSPRSGEVRLRIGATGICGSDLHGYTGENGRRFPGQVMGHETYGIVDLTGDGDHTDITVGTTVVVNPVVACGHCVSCAQSREQHCASKKIIGVDRDWPGSFAEYLIVPIRNAIPVADSLPAGFGALVEPLAVGHHAVARARVVESDRLLVIGGGPIGQSVVLSARRAGVSQIVVSEPDQTRRDLCKRLGVESINPNDDDIVAQLEEIFGQATVAIDAVGVSATVRDALRATTIGARVVLVGMGAIDLDLAAFAISIGERELVGSFTYSAAEFSEVARWVSEEPADLATLLEPAVTIAQGPEAFRAMAAGDIPAGKILVFS